MFILFNATDGILADPRKFKTEGAALVAKQQIVGRIKMLQGYYKTSAGERIAPEDVRFEVRRA